MIFEADAAAVRYRFASEEFDEVRSWLIEEAWLLDERRFDEWLRMLSPDLVYRVPVRVTVPRSLDRSLREDMDLFLEDHHSLTKRVERLATEHAWAEDPPSRTRRFVTNIQVFAGEAPGTSIAHSYLMLVRSRGDVYAPEQLTAVRRDVFGRSGDGVRLAERLVALDDTVLKSQNLTFFL